MAGTGTGAGAGAEGSAAEVMAALELAVAWGYLTGGRQSLRS